VLTGVCDVTIEGVGVGYADVVGYCAEDPGVDVCIVGVEVGMPRAASEDVGIGVEWRWSLVSWCWVTWASDLIG
jgi:hypothetical protein